MLISLDSLRRSCLTTRSSGTSDSSSGDLRELQFQKLFETDLEMCELDLTDENVAYELLPCWTSSALEKMAGKHILPFLAFLLVHRSPKLLPIYFKLEYPFFDPVLLSSLRRGLRVLFALPVGRTFTVRKGELLSDKYLLSICFRTISARTR